MPRRTTPATTSQMRTRGPTRRLKLRSGIYKKWMPGRRNIRLVAMSTSPNTTGIKAKAHLDVGTHEGRNTGRAHGTSMMEYARGRTASLLMVQRQRKLLRLILQDGIVIGSKYKLTLTRSFATMVTQPTRPSRQMQASRTTPSLISLLQRRFGMKWLSRRSRCSQRSSR